MITSDQIRTASHLIAHVSKMLREKRAPSEKDWEYLRSLFGADEAFEVSNNLLAVADNLKRQEEKREKAA